MDAAAHRHRDRVGHRCPTASTLARQSLQHKVFPSATHPCTPDRWGVTGTLTARAPAAVPRNCQKSVSNKVSRPALMRFAFAINAGHDTCRQPIANDTSPGVKIRRLGVRIPSGMDVRGLMNLRRATWVSHSGFRLALVTRTLGAGEVLATRDRPARATTSWVCLRRPSAPVP